MIPPVHVSFSICSILPPATHESHATARRHRCQVSGAMLERHGLLGPIPAALCHLLDHRHCTIRARLAFCSIDHSMAEPLVDEEMLDAIGELWHASVVCVRSGGGRGTSVRFELVWGPSSSRTASLPCRQSHAAPGTLQAAAGAAPTRSVSPPSRCRCRRRAGRRLGPAHAAGCGSGERAQRAALQHRRLLLLQPVRPAQQGPHAHGQGATEGGCSSPGRGCRVEPPCSLQHMRRQGGRRRLISPRPLPPRPPARMLACL